jgi:hypothetical protein
MDLIERFFGWSPDGGDGSVEVATLALALLLIIVFRMAKRGVS